jgi:hypothetical protein
MLRLLFLFAFVAYVCQRGEFDDVGDTVHAVNWIFVREPHGGLEDYTSKNWP